ncbi:GntR family transcriptional regulator [Oharaeibacter diazotrophicus]|uniref:GntR family transcriptional regulator n=1 Tax=Oharaeibacter diazotrophicus TaxID=1920512 RepID=A0A4V3CVW1_9HYPH|nr:GntR family transcriptional regulator [Oharaeibacter diazotrophicus]TDP83978.1 GntR family transcriptional regulator [Oharaeibacter diazotrophicus]BBE73017.1 HTH-type transcriptional regulator McbR [Pleomorphomonas sp. SM30]GLS74805.1 GntR family transcriptional regulator [Oharaeibacter diazotrophicus]
MDTGGAAIPRRSESLRARVYDDLIDRIRRGAVGRDDRLVDTEIAARLGVSRMPVREALLQLTNEGYLVGTTRGFMRPKLTLADVADVFEVRRLLEPRAAAHAAQALDADGLARLDTALAAARAAVTAGDTDGLFRANVAFRDAWTGAVRNVRLTAAIARFVDHVQVVRLATLSDPATQPVVVEGLARLADAFRRRDGVAAHDRMARFIDTAEECFGRLAAVDADGAIDFAGSIAPSAAAG